MERSRPSSGAFPSLKFWGAFDAAAACWWRRRTPSLSRLTGLSRRREEAIEVALRAKLAARAERRAKSSAAARKEIAEFTAEFLSAAREVFELMDEDDSGTLVVDEIVKAVDPKKGNKKVIKFLETCGEPNLQFLVRPKTIRRALRVLDVSGDGEIDIDEWRVMQRLFT